MSNQGLLASLKQDLMQALKALAIIRGVDNEQLLYQAAYAFIGADASPADEAPDEFGCADSLSRVIQKGLSYLNMPLYLATRTLGHYLLNSPAFRIVTEPSAGDIIISITGTGNGKVLNGHCGVVGKNKGPDGTPWIMSNDSRTGMWEVNYTLGAWRRYYVDKGALATYFFEPI